MLMQAKMHVIICFVIIWYGYYCNLFASVARVALISGRLSMNRGAVVGNTAQPLIMPSQLIKITANDEML